MVECTPNTPQVIGISDTFDFDVTHFNPPWMNNIEDGCLTERPRRLQVSDGDRQPLERARPPPFTEANITSLMEMGLATREQAIQVLQAHANDLEAAVAMLLALL